MPALRASTGVAFALALALVRSAAAQPAAAPAPPAPTDIYLAPIRLVPAPAMGPARVATENPHGYDNQPFFGTDARAMLFAANRDGTQTDIYFIELQTRQIRRITSTPESEYSPAALPDESGISVIRVEADGTQRVWKFDGTGGAPAVVARDVKPAGYHAWVDATHLGVFVLGQPPTLQVVDVTTGKATTIATDVGRSLHRRPATGTLTFAHRVDGRWMVREWVPASGAVRDVVAALDGSADRDMAWGPDGTLFMSKDGDVHWWRPGQTGWTLMSQPGIGPISRMAVSPDGRWMALVVPEAR